MIRKILVFVLAAVLMTGCAVPSGETAQKRYQASFLTLFDTVTSIVGYAETEEESKELKKINELKNGKALDYINDILTSETNDELLKNTKDYCITWSSSNENLVYFENGFNICYFISIYICCL